jgi:hypothetical protein
MRHIWAVFAIAASLFVAAPNVAFAQSYDLAQFDPATRSAAEQARVAQLRAIAAASRAQAGGEGTITFDAVEGDKYAGDGYGSGGSAQRNGYGWNNWSDGEYYAGQFRAGGRGGFKDGAGVYYFADGRMYEGQWLNDLRHGYGVQWEANGAVYYAGRWANGNPAQ